MKNKKSFTIKYTIAVGDTFGGMTFYGLFEDPSEAAEWMEQNFRNIIAWKIIPIHPHGSLFLH